MICTLVKGQTLRNITSRIPTFLCRSKSTEASTACKEITNETSDPDLPTLSENPFSKEKRLCILCKLDIDPDFKNIRLLSQFQSRHTGRIYGKHITGLCDYKQKRIEQEIMKAQNAGLMGYMTKDVKYAEDPQLFNPSFPLKPHPY